MIAGKGHEQGQEFEGGRKEPFDDLEVAREALRALGGAARDRPDGRVGRRGGRGGLAAGDPDAPGPARAVIDTREAGAGDLFVGLPRRAAPTAASTRPTRSRRAPGACSSRPARGARGGRRAARRR